jgi:hypothetical protein
LKPVEEVAMPKSCLKLSSSRTDPMTPVSYPKRKEPCDSYQETEQIGEYC